MIGHYFKPKHTLLSVANSIENGLEDGTVFLSDKHLVDAGYEVHELHNIPIKRHLLIIDIIVEMVMMSALIVQFGKKHLNFSIFIALIFAVISTIVHVYFFPKSRLITKRKIQSH